MSAPFNNASKVGDIRSYLEHHEDKINKKIKELGNPKSEFTRNFTSEFMKNREQRIEKSIERLYQSNDNVKVNEG